MGGSPWCSGRRGGWSVCLRRSGEGTGRRGSKQERGDGFAWFAAFFTPIDPCEVEAPARIILPAPVARGHAVGLYGSWRMATGVELGSGPEIGTSSDEHLVSRFHEGDQ